MDKQFRNLHLTQMENRLSVWRAAQLPSRPANGWVRSIRESLGMSASALGRRLGMTHAAINKFEHSEAHDTITLASLQKLAEALGCDLQYALIPRKSLHEQLDEQAHKLAREQLTSLLHSMQLESQGLQDKERERQVESLARDLLEGSRRELWQ